MHDLFLQSSEEQQNKNLLLNPAAPVFRQAGPDKGIGQGEDSLEQGAIEDTSAEGNDLRFRNFERIKNSSHGNKTMMILLRM